MAIIEVSGAYCTEDQHSTLNEGAFLLPNSDSLLFLCRRLVNSKT